MAFPDRLAARKTKMLTRTFVHLPGIGYTTEARWWREGIADWSAFLAHVERPEAARLASHAPRIDESRERLAAGDHRYFAETLARRDHWRAVPEFAGRVAFLDIETTGGTEGEDITVIGLADGQTMRAFVKGRDLEEFPGALAPYGMLVTFFGTGFDVPMLKRRFPKLPFDQLHVDLCHALKRLGYRGGLKKVEEELGLVRAPETRGLSGWDAVRLWREHRFGSREALDLLLAYNREDVLNLRELLAIAYSRLRESTMEP
jgi:uncharacterized protein YprB with RNaseH-like and TPR domain